VCISVSAAYIAMLAAIVRLCQKRINGTSFYVSEENLKQSVSLFNRRLLFSAHTARVNIKTLQNSVEIPYLRISHNLCNKQPLFRFYTFRIGFIMKVNSYSYAIRTASLHIKRLKLFNFSLTFGLLLRTYSVYFTLRAIICDHVTYLANLISGGKFFQVTPISVLTCPMVFQLNARSKA
jgi:hypothetical protein